MGDSMMKQDWAQQVNSFWFDEISPQQWFAPSPELDAQIRERFLSLYEEFAKSVPGVARSNARAALAAIIVLDQFPRNMFRGRPEAFATDTLACALTRNAVQEELDSQLSMDERRFLYMPLMHSEVLADQEWGISLFRSLGDEDTLKYAVEHRDIIEQFGRFPHRNRILGRQSNREEQDFLHNANSYGQ